MVIHALPLPSLLPPFNFRGRPEAKASATVGNPGSSGKKANLSARRQERVFIPNFCDGNGRAFPISDFFRHPTGVEALLNTRALQRFEPLDSNTFSFRTKTESNHTRHPQHTLLCTLYKIQFLKFEVSPVIDLRVTPTDEDCTVEMLSCRFEGSKVIEQQNQLFSAFMRNHITWEADNSEPCFVVDVNLRIALDVYTKPFSLLPLSAVEKPGNLVMQGLLDRLVPLLAEKLHSDYCTWVEQQMNSQI